MGYREYGATGLRGDSDGSADAGGMIPVLEIDIISCGSGGSGGQDTDSGMSGLGQRHASRTRRASRSTRSRTGSSDLTELDVVCPPGTVASWPSGTCVDATGLTGLRGVRGLRDDQSAGVAAAGQVAAAGAKGGFIGGIIGAVGGALGLIGAEAPSVAAAFGDKKAQAVITQQNQAAAQQQQEQTQLATDQAKVAADQDFMTVATSYAPYVGGGLLLIALGWALMEAMKGRAATRQANRRSSTRRVRSHSSPFGRLVAA